MTRITRYGRKIRTTFISTMFAACLAIVVGIPFVSKKMLNNEVGYYSISIQGTPVGAANTEEEVNVALANARLQLSQQLDDYVYMDCDVQIDKENRAIAQRMSEKELESSIYSQLFDCIVDVEDQLAYTVRIGDYTVNLSSKQEVEELFTKLIQPYNRASEFEPVIKADPAADEIQAIGFAQDISVNAVYADKVELSTVQDAYNDITKESQTNTYYIVKEGDTLSQIAKDHDMSLDDLLKLNKDYDEDTVVVPGNELVITVPKSDITVITTKQLSYEEDYQAEPQYMDDNNNYRGTNYVLSEGTTGHRSVVATVTYENGKEVDRQITKENVTVESKPARIAVGTLTPPAYIKPINGGTFSSGYGLRDGEMHYGVDWSCSIGTSVKAARDGVVTRAGWYSGYGYCVDIQHEDGSITRYGHNSQITVNEGQQVKQGEQVALSGSTGDSTTPHVHFEIWIDGRRVNPLDYVNKN